MEYEWSDHAIKLYIVFQLCTIQFDREFFFLLLPVFFVHIYLVCVIIRIYSLAIFSGNCMMIPCYPADASYSLTRILHSQSHIWKSTTAGATNEKKQSTLLHVWNRFASHDSIYFSEDTIKCASVCVCVCVCMEYELTLTKLFHHSFRRFDFFSLPISHSFQLCSMENWFLSNVIFLFFYNSFFRGYSSLYFVHS